MNGNRTVKEYRADIKLLGRQRFLAINNAPVLLAANPHAPDGPGYFTRPQTAPLAVSASYAHRLGFVVDDTYLVMPVAKLEGRPFPERIGVGRTRGTDIILIGSDISKYHAYFTTGAEKWQLTDAGSSNGTFVDGERLASMQGRTLADGALVAFGARLHLFRTATGFADFLSK